MRLQHKVSASLKQALEKLKLSENTEEQKGEDVVFLFCPPRSPSTSSGSGQEGHVDSES